MGEPISDLIAMIFGGFMFGWCFWIGGLFGKGSWATGYKVCRSNYLMWAYGN